MSPATIESVLARAMSDAAFVEELFAQPDKALAGYDLSAEELAQLKNMSRADFDTFTSASPEERKSFGWSNHNQTALRLK